MADVWFDSGDECWDVALDDFPDDLEIDSAVVMHEPVPHADDVAPGTLASSALMVSDRLPAASPDNLNALLHSELQLVILGEFFPTPLPHEGLDAACRDEDIEEQRFVRSHKRAGRY